MVENRKHQGNYEGTTNMQAKNQDMAFVNDTLENAPETTSLNVQKDDLHEEAEKTEP